MPTLNLELKRIRRWLAWPALFAILAVAGMAGQAQGQAACPHATIRLETNQPLDTAAICEAARPWAEDGFQVFILLTDYRTGGEDDWFNYLDRVEIEAGLRGAEPGEGFNKNALALEASTAAGPDWGVSVTYGELLYGSRLDNDQALLQLNDQMRAAIAAGDPTGAFVGALNSAYAINHPPLPLWVWGGLGLVGLGVLGAGGAVVASRVVLPARRRARQRAALRQHLADLRSRTSNLLGACHRLLDGDGPEATVLYQLFSAYGGEQAPDLRRDVREWLRRSQGALNDAFDLRQKLIDPATQAKHPLEAQVQDWELLYVTLAGSSERILEVTDEELRALLDPLLTLDREADDVQLAAQLDDIRRELAGMPLKVDLQTVDLAETDAEGILGYIDQVKAATAHLKEMYRQAPERLAGVQAQRRSAEKAVPAGFVLTADQLFAGIDERLQRAVTALENDRAIEAVQHADEAADDLETVQGFIEAMDDRDRRQAEFDAIIPPDHRPAHLAAILQEIESDIQEIIQCIAAGDYEAAADEVEGLEQDSRRALAEAQAWQALHRQNAEALGRLDRESTRLAGQAQAAAQAAWEALQSYPEGNWADLGDGLREAAGTLARLRGGELAQIERLNSSEAQKFDEAEARLAQTSADLARAEGQLQAVVNRLAEVQVAEAGLAEALDLTEADIARAEAFRDREDVKIGPEVDRQLAEARRRLAESRALLPAREFLAALEAQTTARDLATAARAAASEQVQTINALQEELASKVRSVAGKVGRSKSNAEALAAVMQTTAINKVVRRAEAALSKAKQARAGTKDLEDQALADGLRAAIAAYDEAAQRADEAAQKIAAGRKAHQDAVAQTRAAIDAAQTAIRRAERVVNQSKARGAGRRSLERAKRMLPDESGLNSQTNTALARMRRRAEDAQDHAKEAESQARERIRAAEAQRRRRRSTWTLPSSPFSPPSTGRSSRRTTSRSSRRSGSARASSRRSSSRGSSRRSSSRGSSRRSSSRGSSRRR